MKGKGSVDSMLATLHGSLETLAADSSVRVVVLGAAGKAFCAGHDLKQMKANPSLEYYQRLFEDCSRLMMRIQTLPQPVIARVQGVEEMRARDVAVKPMRAARIENAARRARNTSFGSALIEHAEQYAASKSVRSIYPLTTTAEAFFKRLGYERVERS